MDLIRNNFLIQIDMILLRYSRPEQHIQVFAKVVTSSLARTFLRFSKGKFYTHVGFTRNKKSPPGKGGEETREAADSHQDE